MTKKKEPPMKEFLDPRMSWSVIFIVAAHGQGQRREGAGGPDPPPPP